MATLNLKPTHKALKEYFSEISKLSTLDISTEGSVSPAFATLLRSCAQQSNLTLVEQYRIRRGDQTIVADGALLDSFKLVHGIWEAKDTGDDLEREVQAKFKKGYPKENILFQAPNRVILWQDGNEIINEDVADPKTLIDILKAFFEYQPPAYEQWHQAVEEFKNKVPELAQALLDLIDKERQTNKKFVAAFDAFAELCRAAINPNIALQAVEEMLIQHLLTERIFSKIFDNPDFANRNVIAREIEKVIVAMTSASFSRHEFLKSLDRFYGAIETTASTIMDYSEKQAFLNTVYEKFFQGFSIKVADTHGIVYTPQSIVDFMVRSVEEILKQEFDKSLSDKGVHIIDPFVGTGNFITRIMREMKRTSLAHKHANELHCNEVMLLPYYIASMNIEHEYLELTNEYKPFDGICLVDTFELAESKERSFSFLAQENTERVKRQKEAQIFVVIANPPYNAGQVNENDNNKNRKYPVIDKRVSTTYGKDSQATLVRKLNDPYVKAYRWATDRIGNEGIVAYVSNNSFVEDFSFDGMRKHLGQDFDSIYILDLGGNVRENPKLSGTTHNVFGIKVGVSINFLIKNKDKKKSKGIYYARTDEYWKKEQKYSFLDKNVELTQIKWEKIHPDARNTWITKGLKPEFKEFIPLGTKTAKSARQEPTETIFRLYSLGVSTNRDSVAYNFNKEKLKRNILGFTQNYNRGVDQLVSKVPSLEIDEIFLNINIKWSRNLKRHLQHLDKVFFDEHRIREGLD